MIDAPSPNHEPRAAAAPVDILLLHYTGMESGAAALDRLRDPAAKVSAHYLIEEDGQVFRLVPEARRAWHAGLACWAGDTDVNSRSIGIELVNPGHEFGYRAFPQAQMDALIDLSHGILTRHPIPPHRVLAHSDVAPARKQDPGELFDWRALAEAGLGLWPPQKPAEPMPVDVAWMQAALARFGYCVPENGSLDSETRQAVAAFQRHFRPESVTGEADARTAARLHDLLTLLDRGIETS